MVREAVGVGQEICIVWKKNQEPRQKKKGKRKKPRADKHALIRSPYRFIDIAQ